LANAVAAGQDCTAISNALSAASAEAVSAGVGPAFSEAVAAAESVAACLGKGIGQCRSTVGRTCCAPDYPDTCACTRTRCRASKNTDFTIELLGL